MKELTKKEINNVSGSGLGTILGITALLYTACDSYGLYSGAIKINPKKGISYNAPYMVSSLVFYPPGIPYRTIQDFWHGLKDGFNEIFPRWQNQTKILRKQKKTNSS